MVEQQLAEYNVGLQSCRFCDELFPYYYPALHDKDRSGITAQPFSYSMDHSQDLIRRELHRRRDTSHEGGESDGTWLMNLLEASTERLGALLFVGNSITIGRRNHPTS